MRRTVGSVWVMVGVAAEATEDVEAMEVVGGKVSESSDGMLETRLRAEGEGGGTG